MKRAMSQIRLITLTLVAACISGCNYYEYVNPVPSETLEPATEVGNLQPSYIEEYDLFYEVSDYTPSLYEPKEGVYLGAYILSNKLLNYSIDEFEKKTDREHLIYTYHIKLGEELPLNWVLECTARLKTPLIVIKPPDSGNPFDIGLLLKTLESFDINIPMFVEFYPKPSTLPIKEYIDFFKEARKLFSKQSPSCAFIFSVSGDNPSDEILYYPGDEFVDWVGMNIYMPILEGDSVHDENIFTNIDIVYHTFQKVKPIMITQFAVSHFTSRNHTYYTSQAADTITEIYTETLNSYPRIKGIIYMDFNNVVLLNAGVRDNFSITENETVLDAYSQIIKNKGYISKLVSASDTDEFLQLMKSPFAAKKIGESYYMPDIIYDLPQNFESGEKISDYSVNPQKKHILIYLKK